MQRHTALAIPLRARDFGAAETARAVDADAAGAQAHGRLHGPLHRPAERHAALKLLRDVLGDERRVDLGLAHFDDVQMHFRRGDLADVAAKLLDVGALLADHHARPGGVDRHAALLVRTLDHDLGDTGLLQLLGKQLADLDVFVKELAVFMTAGEPTRIPGAVDTEPQTDRIDLVTHQACSST